MTIQPTDPLGRMYAEWTEEFIANPDMSLRLMRWLFEDWQRVTTEPSDVTYETTELGGVPGILVTPLTADPGQVLVFLHGGGFALGSSASHRKLAGHVAKACGTHAFVADFRRAPEHPFPAQLDDATAVFDALVDGGTDPADITFVGDSAGASIAVATTLRMLRDGRRTPGLVVTVSPWLDMENTGETLVTNDATDFLITREGLQGNIDRYLSGGADPTDPLVNPLYADFAGFPPLYVDRLRRRIALLRRHSVGGVGQGGGRGRHVRRCARMSSTCSRYRQAIWRLPTRVSPPSPTGTAHAAPPKPISTSPPPPPSEPKEQRP